MKIKELTPLARFEGSKAIFSNYSLKKRRCLLALESQQTGPRILRRGTSTAGTAGVSNEGNIRTKLNTSNYLYNPIHSLLYMTHQVGRAIA